MFVTLYVCKHVRLPNKRIYRSFTFVPDRLAASSNAIFFYGNPNIPIRTFISVVTKIEGDLSRKSLAICIHSFS